MGHIADILKSTDYGLDQFKQEEIDGLDQRVTTVVVRNKTQYKVKCLVRKKEIILKPEEVVRQLYLARLINEYGYPVDRLKVEYPVSFGRDNSKRADIVVMDVDKPDSPI